MCDCALLEPLPYKYGIRLGLASCHSRPRIRINEPSKIINGRILPYSASFPNSNTAIFRKGGIWPVIGAFTNDIKPISSGCKPLGGLLGVSPCFCDRLDSSAAKVHRFSRTRSNVTDICGNSGEDFVDTRPRSEDDLNPPRASGDDKKGVRPGAPVPSTYDFLELKRELEKDESGNGGTVEDDPIPAEGFRSTCLNSEEVGGLVGRLRPRSGRQVIRRSNLLAKQVISIQSARSLGFISQLWVDSRSWVVVLLEVRPNLLSGEIEKFLLGDVHQVGDVVLVQDETVMENELKLMGLDTLVGYNVVTSGRQNLGKVRGFTFNINSGAVESLELDSFGFSIIPASLVSTYCLFVEDVLEVGLDTVIVHEAAMSRVQRLTKGIWNKQNLDNYNEGMEEYSDFGREKARSVHGQSYQNFKGRKFRRKLREIEDDWELPMDYS